MSTSEFDAAGTSQRPGDPPPVADGARAAILPLRVGDRGPAVRDLHIRLERAGFPCPIDDVFAGETETAVRAFQETRRIDVDGVVGRHTWAALAEAAYRLGDRLLYHRSSPMVRGDDVAELQRRLGALGFDAGRVDGIFGSDTATALENFQRNAGLPSDAIFGPDSLAALLRLGGRDRLGNVAEVRERERLRGRADHGDELRLVVATTGGLGAVIDTIGRRLRNAGVRVEVLDHPDESHHARIANAIDADLHIEFVADPAGRLVASHFATDGFESEGGARFAALLADEIESVVGAPVQRMGQRLPVLRETRMPAVVLRAGPLSLLVERGPEIADAVTAAVVAWRGAPVAGAEG